MAKLTFYLIHALRLSEVFPQIVHLLIGRGVILGTIDRRVFSARSAGSSLSEVCIIFNSKYRSDVIRKTM